MSYYVFLMLELQLMHLTPTAGKRFTLSGYATSPMGTGGSFPGGKPAET
jgi:hypothetical protein